MPTYLDDNGNPIAAPAKVYLDPSTGEPMNSAPAAQPGFWENLGKTFGIDKNADAWQQWKDHPVASAVDALGGPAYAAVKGAASGLTRSAGEAKQAVEALRAGNPAEAGVHAVSAVPLVGPALMKMSDEAPPAPLGQSYAAALKPSTMMADATPGNVGTALGTAAQVAPTVLGAADEAAPGRPTIPNPPVAQVAANATRRVLAGDVNAPSPGTDTAPIARYQAMRDMGIQPDAADATNSPALQMVKEVNRNSMTASSTYDKAQAMNARALNDYTESVLNGMSKLGPEEGGAALRKGLLDPLDARSKSLNESAEAALNKMSPLEPEAGGAAVQRGLLEHQAELKQQAEQGFSDLDEQLGNQPILGAPGLRQTARKILTENAPYYELHPELEPKKAMSIVRDIADLDDQGNPTASPRDMTYSELHQLRSDLLDFNNNNPDLVKNQANGWIQRLAGAADNAITSPRGSLTRGQVDTFRAANDAWKQMKETYDNPQSPLYSAVRSPSPSTLVKGISATPEMAKTLQSALGGRVNPLGGTGMGPIQRGVAEAALGTTKDGGYDFGNFQGRWNKLPEDYRSALFTPEQQMQLEAVGREGAAIKEAQHSPTSPFYHAGRLEPSDLANGLPQTPEMVRKLQNAVGPEGMGPIQRGVLEKLLRTTNDGNYNFKTFQGQWNRMPEDYRNALFTPEQQAKIENIGHAGTVLNIEPNPSGTAKLDQKVGETKDLFNPLKAPINALYHPAQAGVARLMNHPAFVDWLMKNPDVVKDMESGTRAGARAVSAAWPVRAIQSEPSGGEPSKAPPAAQPVFPQSRPAVGHGIDGKPLPQPDFLLPRPAVSIPNPFYEEWLKNNPGRR